MLWASGRTRYLSPAISFRRSLWNGKPSSDSRLKHPSRKQRHLFEPHGLREAEHQVHVLHRLAGGALHQVVERGADDGARGDAVARDPDEGHVGAAHMAGLRRRPQRQHMTERAPPRSLLKYPIKESTGVL